MEQLPIEVLASNVIQFFSDAGYTERSVDAKKYTMNTIVRLHHEHGHMYYDQTVMESFLSDTMRKYDNGDIGRIRFMFLNKTAQYLTSFYNDGYVQLATPVERPSGLTHSFAEVIKEIQDYANWSDKTKDGMISVARPYMKWLQLQGHSSFEFVTQDDVRMYFIEISSRMKVTSIDTIRRQLKKLHKFLCESTNVTCCDLSGAFAFPVPTEHKIKRPVPQNEIADVLSIIDRSTPKGKRDYAIIMIAAVTGLRAVDIAGLRLSDIDWIHGEIIIQQSKTERILSLPLTTDVGKAIQDYILFGRPDNEDSHVFLNCHAPHAPLTRNTPYVVFNEYRKKIGLAPCQFHGLRRSVGTNLVIEGVPVTTVAQILGHSSIEPTKQYISLDCSHLKECALDLSDLPAFGGALS